jgi:predicted peptidase
MSKRWWYPAGLLVILPAVWLCADEAKPEAQPGQSAKSLKKRVEVEVKCDYLLFLPQDYGKDKDKRWPLILFLHGSGERGSDLNKVKVHGPPKVVESTKKDLPFIVVSPQCPEGQWWDPDVLAALLDDIAANYSVDASRVYLTGLSMGGYGTWETAIEYPERFAAIAPICGGGNPFKADRIKAVPTWVFHGEKDEGVPIRKSEEMVEALKRAGGNVEFTRYPDAGHDSWTVTYDNPALYEWFLKHHK